MLSTASCFSPGKNISQKLKSKIELFDEVFDRMVNKEQHTVQNFCVNIKTLADLYKWANDNANNAKYPEAKKLYNRFRACFYFPKFGVLRYELEDRFLLPIQHFNPLETHGRDLASIAFHLGRLELKSDALLNAIAKQVLHLKNGLNDFALKHLADLMYGFSILKVLNEPLFTQVLARALTLIEMEKSKTPNYLSPQLLIEVAWPITLYLFNDIKEGVDARIKAKDACQFFAQWYEGMIEEPLTLAVLTKQDQRQCFSIHQFVANQLRDEPFIFTLKAGNKAQNYALFLQTLKSWEIAWAHPKNKPTENNDADFPQNRIKDIVQEYINKNFRKAGVFCEPEDPENLSHIDISIYKEPNGIKQRLMAIEVQGLNNHYYMNHAPKDNPKAYTAKTCWKLFLLKVAGWQEVIDIPVYHWNSLHSTQRVGFIHRLLEEKLRPILNKALSAESGVSTVSLPSTDPQIDAKNTTETITVLQQDGAIASLEFNYASAESAAKATSLPALPPSLDDFIAQYQRQLEDEAEDDDEDDDLNLDDVAIEWEESEGEKLNLEEQALKDHAAAQQKAIYQKEKVAIDETVGSDLLLDMAMVDEKLDEDSSFADLLAANIAETFAASSAEAVGHRQMQPAGKHQQPVQQQFMHSPIQHPQPTLAPVHQQQVPMQLQSQPMHPHHQQQQPPVQLQPQSLFAPMQQQHPAAHLQPQSTFAPMHQQQFPAQLQPQPIYHQHQPSAHLQPQSTFAPMHQQQFPAQLQPQSQPMHLSMHPQQPTMQPFHQNYHQPHNFQQSQFIPSVPGSPFLVDPRFSQRIQDNRVHMPVHTPPPLLLIGFSPIFVERTPWQSYRGHHRKRRKG